MSVNSRLKVIKIIGQRKAFYRQIIPESSCARKQTVDIEIPHPLKSSTVEWLTKRTKKTKQNTLLPFSHENSSCFLSSLVFSIAAFEIRFLQAPEKQYSSVEKAYICIIFAGLLPLQACQLNDSLVSLPEQQRNVFKSLFHTLRQTLKTNNVILFLFHV